jgi:mannan endo-1,4-beta-mannosidase
VTKRVVALLLPAVLVAVASCSSSGGSGGAGGQPGSTGTGGRAGPTEPTGPYDVRPLLRPRHKYLGVALPGAPTSMAPVQRFAASVGRQPNLLLSYAAWGDRYREETARNVWNAGALQLIAWEPFRPRLADIANGASDDYVRSFASAVRRVNVPVAISFGHEMNGFWFPWGTASVGPGDFVRAWRRVHDLFGDAGATNVIWVWNPNVVNPVPEVALQPLYPGDAYVDWIGLSGYYTLSGARTFRTLFGPTLAALRGFTRKPVLIAETGAMPGRGKRRAVADLFAGVASSRNVLGLIWFEYDKEVDWRVGNDPSALAEFARRAADRRFGFDIRHP